MVLYQTFVPESYVTKDHELEKNKKQIGIDTRIVKSVATPWISGTEWKNVYRQLFDPSSSPHAWREAYTTMVRWSRMTRVNVPTAVVATIHLLRAKNMWRSYHARSPTATTPDWLQQCFTTPREQTLLYTNLAIVQFVNAFVKEEEHRHDVRGNAVSFKELGSMAGLPECCVAMRNNFVHNSAVGALADENGLRETVLDQLWLWIKMQYWDVELEALAVSERLQEALKGVVLPPPELRIDVQQLLQPSPDNDPRETLFLAIDTALRKEAESHDGLISCRKKRVRAVVEEVVQQLLLQDHLLKKFHTRKDPQCVCGCRLKVKPVTSILNMLCWLLTHALRSALRAPTPRAASAGRPVKPSRLKKHTDAIIAKVLASQDVADAGYTVADHVLAVLTERATVHNNILAKQWLLILAGNCCPAVANAYRKSHLTGERCSHYDMFVHKSVVGGYPEVAGNSEEKRVVDPSSSEAPWREFYPRQLPAPAVRWRPLVRRMLDAKDVELNSLAWRIAEGTFPAEDILRLRNSYLPQQDPFDGECLDGLNTSSFAASDVSAPISSVKSSGTMKRLAGISVDQLLEAMAGGGADHLHDEEDSLHECVVDDIDVPCNTGRGALTFNIDTLSQQLVLIDPENNTGGSSGNVDEAATETPFEDKQQETVNLPKFEDEVAAKDIDLVTKDVKRSPRKAIAKRLKRHTPKSNRKNLLIGKQTPKSIKSHLNVSSNIAKCEDDLASKRTKLLI